MKLTNNKGNFTPAPMGLHKGVCVDVIDLGMLPTLNGGMRQKVNLCFELSDALMEDGRPFIVYRRFTASLAETAHLSQFLAKWRGGIPIKQGEEVDLDTLIGKAALLVLTHTTKDGNTYANIDSILPCAEAIRPSGHYKRKDPQQPKQQFGSAVKQPVPLQAQPSTRADRTAFPSPAPIPSPLPATDEMYREGALGITGKPATAEQKAKFLGLLLPVKDHAAKYFNSIGALGNDQPLEELPPQYCPTTKTQFDNIMGSIQAFMDTQAATAEDDSDSVPF